MIVSIFGKRVDKSRAKIEFSERQLDVDLPMPDNKRYKISFPLYAAIDPTGCEYQILGTKVELKLKKGNVDPYPPVPREVSAHNSSGWNLVANLEKR